MMSKRRRNSLDSSPKVAEVGEIDTSSPFSSVKHAVSLFRNVSISGEKTPMRKARAQSAEIAFEKQMQFHLADKELNKLNDQIKNAEAIKVEALAELGKAKRTFDDLTLKLKSICESKESAVRVTEAANDKLRQLEEEKLCNSTSGEQELDIESAREQYITAIAELNDRKQELTRIRRDFDLALEARVSALKSEEKAEGSAKTSEEKARDISREISILKESIGIVKVASLQAQEAQAKKFAEKDAEKQSYIAALEESAKKLLNFKNESDPEIAQKLEAQLTETNNEIASLRKEIDNIKASDQDSLKAMALDFDGAKESLQKVAKEEASLTCSVDDLKTELENVKKEHSEFTKKESETEFMAGDLNAKLQRIKSELEACIQEEAKSRTTSDRMASSLHHLNIEKETAQIESEEMSNEADSLRKETESARTILEEHETKLRVALQEAEEAKEAESKAVEEIKNLTEATSAARAMTSRSAATIRISRGELESLSRKVEEWGMLAEMKVSAAMAQVEAVKAGEKEAGKKLEASLREAEEVKATTESVLRRADMAEAAKMTVDGELRRWREREQKKKKAVELTKSRSSSSTLLHSSGSQKKQGLLQKTQSTHNLGKSKSVSKKSLMHNFSGIFQKKKKKNLSVDGGSPSYLSDIKEQEVRS